MNGKLKLALLYILSILASVLPILIYFLVNLEKYTKTVPQTIKLCSGAGILLFFLFLKVIGKLHIPSGLTLYSIIFILAYLLESILNDLMIFAFFALVGELLSLIFDVVIRNKRAKLEKEKTASITAAEVEKIITKHVGGGRV